MTGTATTNGLSAQSNKRPLDRRRIAPGVARFPTPPPPWLMCGETHLQNSGKGGVAADLEDWIGGSNSYNHKVLTDK
ncbi:hypothetical protein BT69DRAFT_1291420 [Atractiella rhizophila]|nr:hypothetical protein BT69DRAFT_1291420 [Atractiella rhizophila]